MTLCADQLEDTELQGEKKSAISTNKNEMNSYHILTLLFFILENEGNYMPRISDILVTTE